MQNNFSYDFYKMKCSLKRRNLLPYGQILKRLRQPGKQMVSHKVVSACKKGEKCAPFTHHNSLEDPSYEQLYQPNPLLHIVTHKWAFGKRNHQDCSCKENNQGVHT